MLSLDSQYFLDAPWWLYLVFCINFLLYLKPWPVESMVVGINQFILTEAIWYLAHLFKRINPSLAFAPAHVFQFPCKSKNMVYFLSMDVLHASDRFSPHQHPIFTTALGHLPISALKIGTSQHLWRSSRKTVSLIWSLKQVSPWWMFLIKLRSQEGSRLS